MKKIFKHVFLAASLVVLGAMAVSCNEAPLVNLDEYQVDVKMIPGTMLTDGTVLSVPQLRVSVSHPEGAGRIMQVNAYAFGERLDEAVNEGKSILMPLDFEQFESRLWSPADEVDVRVTVVYGFDGSGGGPRTVYEESFPMSFEVSE